MNSSPNCVFLSASLVHVSRNALIALFSCLLTGATTSAGWEASVVDGVGIFDGGCVVAGGGVVGCPPGRCANAVSAAANIVIANKAIQATFPLPAMTYPPFYEPYKAVLLPIIVSVIAQDKFQRKGWTCVQRTGMEWIRFGPASRICSGHSASINLKFSMKRAAKASYF